MQFINAKLKKSLLNFKFPQPTSLEFFDWVGENLALLVGDQIQTFNVTNGQIEQFGTRYAAPANIFQTKVTSA